MVKLIYNGVMARGRYKSQHFEGIVNKGEKYDITTNAVDEFIKSGDWKRIEKKSKFEKKVKEDLTIVDEDIIEEFSDNEDKIKEEVI